MSRRVHYRTVVKIDDQGRKLIDIEEITCDGGDDPSGHIYDNILKTGPRKGRPRFGTICFCGKESWEEEDDALLDASKTQKAAR